MAELILTDEEKAADSYLEWDDVSIGRAVRYGIQHLAETAKDFKKQSDAFSGMTATVYLISKMVKVNGEKSEFTVEGLTCGEERLGDIRVTVERLDTER